VGLRDRAVLGVLAYTGARIGALARLRCGDFQDHGPQRVLRFREKGGKEREIPVRHDLDDWLSRRRTRPARIRPARRLSVVQLPDALATAQAPIGEGAMARCTVPAIPSLTGRRSAQRVARGIHLRP